MKKTVSIMMLAALMGGSLAPTLSFAKERSHKHRSSQKSPRIAAQKRGGEKPKRTSARNVNNKAAKSAKAPSTPASISG